MPIIGKENHLGNKAKNIFILEKSNFLIPKTIILNKTKIKNFNFKNLEKNKKYILRPSFENEDGIKKSFAGYFKSIICKNTKEIKKILYLKNIEKIFSGEKNKLKSIIIQEFIETNIYGVYFTRNPNNIFLKGFYEIGETNNQITSGEKKINLKLNFFQEKELEFIGKKLENIFNYPQDIEFCIKNNKIILFQTRNITTGNHTFYNFNQIKKINGIYINLDFDELGEKQDYFSYFVLNKLFDIIYINSKIYFKKSIFPFFLFKKIQAENKNLNNFCKNYKIYLLKKYLFNFVKYFLFQKLDKKVLEKLFKNYHYNFLLKNNSNLDLKFNYKTNLKTKLFLNIEKQKNKAFYYLEKYKKEFNKNNYYQEKNYDLSNKLIFLNGIIINKQNIEEKYNWIYKGKIEGIIVNTKNFKYKKGLKQVLIIKNLNIDLYNKIKYLSGIIIKNGNSLSHNAIILREYKIPSIINYKDFDKLKIGKQIIL